MTDSDVSAEAEEVDRLFRERCQDSFLTFASGIYIPSASGKQLFRPIMTDFQKEFFNAVSPSLHAVRDGTMPPIRRFWTERTKKAAKDSDLAVCLTWLTAFAKRPFLAQVCAGKLDQAGIVQRRILGLLYCNPWLNDLIRVVQNRVLSRDDLCEVKIEATGNSKVAHGDTPDLLILNEVTHVDKWEVIETHMDNADGVPQGMRIIATNAGFKGTKAEALRGIAEESPGWYFQEWTRPAPWLSLEDIEENKKRNTISRYNRLFRGIWSSGKGDALREEDVDRCFRKELRPIYKPQLGWRYIAGLDLGVHHDHSGLVILGVNYEEQKIRIAWHRDWAPGKEGKVDLIDVEDVCYQMYQAFNIQWFGYDPHQAELMAQRLVRRRVPMREMTFSSPTNLTAMAVCLIQVVEGGNLECYEDEEGVLRRDFGKFNIIERSSGYKLESVADEFGHADVGTALVICLPKAVEMLEMGLRLRPEDVIADDDDTPLTDKEIKDMPDTLREIYDVYDDMEQEYKRGRGRGRGRRIIDRD